MDNPEPIIAETPNPDEKFEIEELIINDEYKIQFKTNNNDLEIKVVDIYLIDIYYYQNDYSLSGLKKLSNAFSNYNTTKDVITFIKSLKIEIEEKDDHLIIKLNVVELNEQNKLIELKLIKFFFHKKDDINPLIEEIRSIKKNNKAEKIKNESEIKELKENISNYQKEIANLKENVMRNELNFKNDILNLKEENKFLWEEINDLKRTMQYSFIIQNLSLESKILDKISKLSFIFNYIIKNDREFDFKKIILLYRGSKNGDHTKTCHELCDNKQNILIFMKSDAGYIFGGYTKIGFKTINAVLNYEYKIDNNCFLFSINLEKIYPVIKDSKVICHIKNTSGLCFHNSLLFRDGFMNRSENFISKTIKENFNGLNDEFEMNGGKEKFKCKELEVFQLC